MSQQKPTCGPLQQTNIANTSGKSAIRPRKEQDSGLCLRHGKMPVWLSIFWSSAWLESERKLISCLIVSSWPLHRMQNLKFHDLLCHRQSSCSAHAIVNKSKVFQHQQNLKCSYKSAFWAKPMLALVRRCRIHSVDLPVDELVPASSVKVELHHSGHMTLPNSCAITNSTSRPWRNWNHGCVHFVHHNTSRRTSRGYLHIANRYQGITQAIRTALCYST